jgi:hypothetical protein
LAKQAHDARWEKHKLLSLDTHKYKTTFTSTTKIVLRFSTAGADGMECNEPKMKPKFTGGKGLKRLKGKSLWNKEGMNFFYTADENWQKI